MLRSGSWMLDIKKEALGEGRTAHDDVIFSSGFRRLSSDLCHLSSLNETTDNGQKPTNALNSTFSFRAKERRSHDLAQQTNT
jgi:hypothetical protein